MLMTNIQIHGLAESIYRSGYPMMTTLPTEYQFESEVKKINKAISEKDYENSHIKRAINLANAKGGGHNQFLTGITVQFDLSFPLKVWTEAQRYKFLNFVSSMSSAHKIDNFNIEEMCNDFVDEEIVQKFKNLQDDYLYETDIEIKKIKREKLLYNIPSGFVLPAGMTTNYRCLQNIVAQRYNHRLSVWREFCKEVSKLPMAKELIMKGIVLQDK